MTAQLPLILVRNSFNILGLSSSSTLKEIRKRSQQLLQLAKIGETEEFDTDIGHVMEFRNESEIRVALERVSGIKERLKEIFFWFEDHNIDNRKAIAHISKGSYQEALDVFEKAEGANSDWLWRKNRALALMFHAFATSSLSSFCRSLDLWKLISESNDFWKFYEKHYLLHDELGTSASLFEEFRSSFSEILSAKAVSFYHQTKNPEAIGACYSAFGRIDKTADTEILQPVILKVKKEIEELEKISSSDLDASTVRSSLKKIHKYFSELDKFELSEYSPLIVLKNDTAEKLRSISVSIYNQNADVETAYLFLDQAGELAISEAITDKIAVDKRQLQENKAWQSVSGRFEKIESLINNQKIEDAKSIYLELDIELAKQENDSSGSSRVQLLINFCSVMMANGHALFSKKMFNIRTLAIDGLLNRKNYKNCINIFNHISEIITERITILKLSEIWSTPTEDSPDSELVNSEQVIRDLANSLENCELSGLIGNYEVCLKIIEKLAYKHTDSNAAAVINQLGIASCCSVAYRRIYGLTQEKMWKWIGCGGAAIFFYFFVIMGNDKQEPKSSYKTSYQEKPTYSSPSQYLSYEEKGIIEYLEENKPEALKNIRKSGYSDKEIAQYVIEHAEDKKE